MKKAIKLTENYLESYSSYFNDIFPFENLKWAFVGGFVRDTLISFLLGKKISSPDIDIALIGELPHLEENNEILNINKNTFGGLKVKTKKYGNIDIWNPQKFFKNREKEIDWGNYLMKIDFSINSILFSYPEHKLYLHNDWIKSYKNRQISELYEYSPSPDLQLIRAMALTINLSAKTGLSFHTSKVILDKMSNLLMDYDNPSFAKILEYTTEKIIIERWPDSVLRGILDLKVSLNKNNTNLIFKKINHYSDSKIRNSFSTSDLIL
jgi:hypothetical protein